MDLPLRGTAVADTVELPDHELEAIRKALLSRRGVDIASYKEAYIRRRISIRVRATGSPSAASYAALLAASRDECDLLLKALTIHVSHFFRNRETFQRLVVELMPELIRKADAASPLLLWSAGAASGEEAYTVALLLLEHFPDEVAAGLVRILATDIDAGILATARAAVYPPERLEEMPAAYVEKYFSCIDGRYHLDERVRTMVEFSCADLLQPDTYPASDIILCRNVLMYLERPEQERILHGFSRVLPASGLLVLGRPETLAGDSHALFQPVSAVERIYAKI